LPNYKLKKCAICDKEFQPHSGRSKYCSKECIAENNRRLDRESYQRRRKPRLEKMKQQRALKPGRQATCKQCDRNFRTKTNAKYCCAECRENFWREQRLKPGPIRDKRLKSGKDYYRRNTATAEGTKKVNQQQKKSRQRYKEKHGISKSTADRNANPERAFWANIRSSVHQWLNNNNTEKNQSAVKYIGCSRKDLEEWISIQFRPGMHWKNQGKEPNNWQLDHVRPLSSFNIQQANTAWNWRNLQPLWQQENNKKGDKYDHEDETLWKRRMQSLRWDGPLYLKYSDED